MLKQLLLKKLISSQLKGVPPEQQAAVLAAFEKDPDFFMRIAQEADEKTKSGLDRMAAAQEVFAAHQDELKRLLGQ